eukprot:1952054-Amphidinium_carterae.2
MSLSLRELSKHANTFELTANATCKLDKESVLIVSTFEYCLSLQGQICNFSDSVEVGIRTQVFNQLP